MRLHSTRLYATALTLCLFVGARAGADQINWSYNWTPAATEVFADNPAGGKLVLTNEPGGSTTGDSYIVATNIKTVSTANPMSPATFTNTPYSLTLAIYDEVANASKSMKFSGAFSGVLSAKSAIIMNTFTGSDTQAVQIGSHLYTVKIGPFSPPGPPTATNSGSISALANVTVQEVPEPTTLALAGICLSVCGAGWWLRRRTLRVELA